MSAVAQAATRVSQRAPQVAEQMLPIFDDVARSAHSMDDVLQRTLDLPFGQRPRIVLVGIGRTPPKTTQSIIEKAVERGLVPGEDIIATRYRDLRVGKDRGFVRLAEGTGADGLVLAGQGQQSLFLYRGGGNLKEQHFRKIAAIDAVDGATSITDLSAIKRLGSKEITNDVLAARGIALPRTIPVHGREAAHAAYREISEAFGEPTVVLKKVNSLGGKDVHFVNSLDEVDDVLRAGPKDDYVMQEFLRAAKDQDIRVHGVWNATKGQYELPNSYVRNRNAFELTPNLANGGYPTNYILSPWEEQQVLRSMSALAEGSPRPPLHVGLDLFPRRPITATVVESNAGLQEAVKTGRMTLEEAMAKAPDTAVIGEAATSAGTKGTELVLGTGVNPVTEQIVEGMLLLRKQVAATAR